MDNNCVANSKLRKVFLDELPRWGKNGKAKEGTINWKACVGYIVKFIYEDINGFVEIVDYCKEKLYIRYLNNDIFCIKAGHFKQGQLGKLLEKRTNNFKIEIGRRFKDGKRDIEIIDREYRTEYNDNGSIRENWRWYKYQCNICGWNEGWALEGDIMRGRGCSCCNGKTIVKGINDIATTHPHLVKYFNNIEDTYIYSYQCNKEVILRCPDCGNEKKMRIYSLTNNKFRCNKCGDGISYPQKIMFSVLEQLGLNFIPELSKTIFKWCMNYNYDFYFSVKKEDYLLETHGEQHYKQTSRKGARSLRQEQENDRVKKELALVNGIKPENYIVIDCRKSKLEWIKNSILTSRLNEIFDLSLVDWNKADEFALSSKIKEACKYWSCGIYTTNEIAKIMKLNKSTICEYLNKGSRIWDWVNYDGKLELIKSNIKNGKAVTVKEM